MKKEYIIFTKTKKCKMLSLFFLSNGKSMNETMKGMMSKGDN